MKYLQGLTVYFWSANHIALQLSQGQYTYKNGVYDAVYDEDDHVVRKEKFRALTHDSEFKEVCSSSLTPVSLKDIINSWFDNKKEKRPSIIEDFWEDCSQYIREDQVEVLKSLYQVMLAYSAFDDDEDLEEGYDDEDLEEGSNIKLMELFGIDDITGPQRRMNSLVNAEQYELLQPLVSELRESKSALKNKYILLDFVEELKSNKGLGIDLSIDANEETMYGKLPLKEWRLPFGNSLMAYDGNYLDNLNLFGISVKGIDNGIQRFDEPGDLIHL